MAVASSEETLKNDGKLLLLMRVLFELPERSATATPRFYPWRTHGTDRNPDGTVNCAWPITWNDGSPRLLSGATSIQGAVDLYDPAGEFEYFRANYRYRDLKRMTAVQNQGR